MDGTIGQSETGFQKHGIGAKFSSKAVMCLGAIVVRFDDLPGYTEPS